MTRLRPDFDEARRFLNALDPDPQARFTFQTFDDSREKSKFFLARIIHGSFDEAKDQLDRLNQQGAGVFVTVNQTDLQGRTKSNIRSVRSIFVDSDDGPIKWPAAGHPEPSIVVESIGGQHAYWLVEQGSVELDEFSWIQSGLARALGTDPAIKGLQTVMRMPGFWHRKSDARLVRMSKCSPTERHRPEDIVRAFKISADHDDAAESNIVQFDKTKLEPHQRNKVERCRQYMSRVGPAIEGDGGDKTTMITAMIGGDFDLSDDEFWPIFQDWNTTCHPPWNEADLMDKLKRCHKYRTNAYGYRLVESKNVVFISDRKAEEDAYWERVLSEEDYYASSQREYRDDCGHGGTPGNGGGDGGDGDGDGDGDGGPQDGPSTSPRKDGPVLSTFSPIWTEAPDAAASPRVMGEKMLRENQIMQHVSKAIYRYDGKVWTSVSKEFLCGMAMEYDYFEYTTDIRRKKTVDYALARNQKHEIQWNCIKKFEVPLKGGVLNVLNGKLRDHHWGDFLDACLPLEWNPRATCPLWYRCLDDWFHGEEDKKLALQEFFGYIILSGTNEYKKALFLYGESNTGKSVVASVARELVGLANLCQIRLEDMDDVKKRAAIKGKMLNLITEVKAWSTLSDSGFKQLVSTGDPVEIEKKFVNSMTIIPTCKHMIATNNLPQITDQTQGVYNRLLILKFDHVIPKSKMDPHLLDLLVQEMEGILVWAVEGARRLVESSGVFTRVASSDAIISEYKETNNRVKMFIEHGGVVVEEPDAKIRTNRFRELFNRYKGGKPVGARILINWCRSAGLDVPDKKFGGYRCVVGVRELTAAEQAEGGGQLRILDVRKAAQSSGDEPDI